jgi:hypothetical protein
VSSESDLRRLIRDAFDGRTTFYDHATGGTQCLECGLVWTFPPPDPEQPCPRCKPEASRVYQEIHHAPEAEAR